MLKYITIIICQKDDDDGDDSGHGDDIAILELDTKDVDELYMFLLIPFVSLLIIDFVTKI